MSILTPSFPWEKSRKVFQCELSGIKFSRLRFCRGQVLEGGTVHAQGHRQHDDLHHQLGPDHAVQPHRQVHEDEQRNVQQALAAGGEDGGLDPLAHGLEGVADEKVHRRQGHRQAGDAQEGGPQGAGLRLRDEQMEELGANAAKQATQQAEKIRAAFQEK